MPPPLSSLTLFIPLKKFEVTITIVSDLVLFMYLPANSWWKCWLTYQPGIGRHVVQTVNNKLADCRSICWSKSVDLVFVRHAGHCVNQEAKESWQTCQST